MIIREAKPESDWANGIWPIFREVVRGGDAFAFPPESTEEEAKQFWLLPLPAKVFVAIDETTGEILGSSFVKPVQPGLGSHVANAAFMVSAAASGKGVGRALGEHAIDWARRSGYAAMQFNIVVSTNQRAIALWKNLGFSIIGTVPEGFQHRREGERVDTFIMHRFL